MAVSTGLPARSSSMKSPKLLSSVSPTGRSRLIGWRLIFSTRRVSASVMSASLAISSWVGSRPRSCISSFEMFRSRLIVSIMWTGMRIVRAWSAIARVIAWRIHQVA